MDTDLDLMSRDQLIVEVKRLRAGIRDIATPPDALCWHHPALWGLLPEKTDPVPEVPDWPQFMRGCIRYRQSLDEQLPNAPRTVGVWRVSKKSRKDAEIARKSTAGDLLLALFASLRDSSSEAVAGCQCRDARPDFRTPTSAHFPDVISFNISAKRDQRMRLRVLLCAPHQKRDPRPMCSSPSFSPRELISSLIALPVLARSRLSSVAQT